jgi:peptidoglycan/LPS O-acetylase OafA/YrhL
MTAKPRADRIASVDALRFAAASLVMFGHTSVPWSTLPTWTKPGHWLALSGGTGVSLFLVISGFSITLRWADRESRQGAFPVKAFWLRRFFRLYPTFWWSVLLCFALLVLARGPEAVAGQPRPWLFLAGDVPVPVQVLGYATVVTANLIPLAHMGRAWSLALEEQLYAAYTFIQVRWHHLNPVRLLVWCALSVLVYRLALLVAVPGFGSLSTGPIDKREVYASFQVPELAFPWVAGWCIAHAMAGNVAVPRAARSLPVASVLLCSGLLLRPWGGPVLDLPGGRECAPVDLALPLLFAAGFAVLVASVVLEGEPRRRIVPRPVMRFATWAGLWSYSLYLLHPPVLELVHRRAGLPLVLEVGLSWVAALVVSWAFWVTVERRWVERSRRVPVIKGAATIAPQSS